MAVYLAVEDYDGQEEAERTVLLINSIQTKGARDG